jgi:sulfate-transporting ATPase
MIKGMEQPDSGEVVLGQTAKISLVDQSREDLAIPKPCLKMSPMVPIF